MCIGISFSGVRDIGITLFVLSMQQKANISNSVVGQLSNFTPKGSVINEFKRMKSVNEDVLREYQQNKEKGNLVSYSNKAEDDMERHKFEDFVEDRANKETKMLIEEMKKNGISSIDELYQQNYPNYMSHIKKCISKIESKIDQSNVNADVSNINTLRKLGDIIKKMVQGSKKLVEDMFKYGGKKLIKGTNLLGVQSQFLGAFALVLFPIVAIMAGEPGTGARIALSMIGFIIAGRIAQMTTEISADKFDIRVMSNRPI